MGESEMMRLGFLTGIIIGCCFVIWFLKVTKRDGSLKCKYDERQQMVRGRGFKYGFFGWMIFNAVCIVTDIGWEERYMDQSMTLFCGMLIGIAIYASYSIWHDGYFSLNENPKRIMAILIVVTMLNIVCAAYQIENGLLENGVLTLLNGCNLSVAITSLFLLIVIFVKWNSDRRNLDKGQTI